MSSGGTLARRLPWSFRVPLVLSLGVLLLASTTLIRWMGPAVALSYRWQQGQVIRDHLRMDMRMRMTPALLEEDLELSFEATSVTRVVSVDPRGNATIELSTEDVELRGQSLPSLPGELTNELEVPQTLVIARDGRVLESSNPFLGPETMGDQGFMTNPLLPDEPVGPGDAWEIDHFQKLGSGNGGFDLHADNRLLRYDEVHGVETVVIRSEMSGPFDFSFSQSDLESLLPKVETTPSASPKLKGLADIRYSGTVEMEGEYWVNPLNGDTLRSEGSGSFSFTFAVGGQPTGIPSLGMEMDMDIETERLA